MRKLGLAACLLALATNAHALQIADGQYAGSYNDIDLGAAQVAFNGLSPKGSGGGVPVGTIVAVPSHLTTKFLENEPEAWLECSDVDTAGTALATLMTRTPNLNGANSQPKRFLQGTMGTSGTVEAGLPNIKGYYYTPYYYSPYWNGVTTGPFVKAGTNSTDGSRSRLYGALDGGTGANTLGFNASLANSIYNDDVHTVQPPAYTVRYYIRANE